MQVAVMVACYNRKEITKRCLDSLAAQISEITDKQIDVYAYDDCSTDGTYEMLLAEFPDVHVIKGKGGAYWCRSMYHLMKTTVNKNYDFYMMINDDVVFYADAIEKMFHAYHEAGASCGIVGAFRSAVSRKCTYGGCDKDSNLMSPNGHIQQCIWANWNCFLIDADVVKKIGIIDGKYQHAWGDWDYSYRMINHGIPIYETADYIGECEKNSEKNTYEDSTLNRKTRIKKLFSPKGLPIASYLRYNIKVNGAGGFFRAIYVYCSIVGYILMGKEFRGEQEDRKA